MGGLPSPFHADALGFGIAVPQTGSIQNADGSAIHRNHLLQHIAGSAGLVGDDGFLAAGQGIEQGGLTGVGSADDSHRHTLPDEAAPLKALMEGAQSAFTTGQHVKGFFVFKGVQILVGIIAHGVKMGQ